MITYASFQRRVWAFVIATLVDLFAYAVLDSIGVGRWIEELTLAWVLLHRVGLVAEGGNFGHFIMGLRVVREDGSRLGVGRSALRVVVELVSMLPLGLGFLWMLDQPQRQCWHDLAASSVVVREQQSALQLAPSWAASPPWRTDNKTDASNDKEGQAK